MPSSDFSQIGPIVELIVLANPRSLLDIGCGFGKYGVLAREYLELWDGRDRYGEWTRRIDAIEAFEAYLTPLHRYVYDEVFIGDAAAVVPRIARTYDLALLIDVIEHCTHDAGNALVATCLARSRNLLIATPKTPGVQGPAFGNPAETHRSRWQEDDLRAVPNSFLVPHSEALICFAGKDAKRVWSARLRARLARETSPGQTAPAAPPERTVRTSRLRP